MTDTRIHALLAKLGTRAELAREVADLDRPHDASEWNGLDRMTVYQDLSREIDQLLDELTKLGADWYEAYWGEPRKGSR